jgi:hypothetical protein
MAAAALLLDRWARHRTVRAEDAAVARLGFKQCLTACALVKILARVRRHDFLARVPAIRAGEHGFQDNGAHGFAMSFEGNPASAVIYVRLNPTLATFPDHPSASRADKRAVRRCAANTP